MSSKKKKPPPQASRLNFEGLEASRFWLRALDLQKKIEEAVSMFKLAPKEHDRISCPIVTEYEIEGWGTFLCAMMVDVDHLGLTGGVGSIYFASPERLEEVTKIRDELADDMMKMIRKKAKVGGMVLIEPGKERGRPE